MQKLNLNPLLYICALVVCFWGCESDETIVAPDSAQSTVARAVVTSVISLKGSNGLYVSGEEGTQAMRCNRSSISSLEKFSLLDEGSGKVSLRSKGMYVSSENGAEPMNCNRASVGGWELFTMVQNSDGTVSFKGNNGEYVSSENGSAAMNCNRSSIQGWEKFELIVHSGTPPTGGGSGDPDPVDVLNPSLWNLQTPDGNQISLTSSTSNQYYYKASDGSQTFYAPRTGTTTTNSNYTRSELRQKSNWSVSGTHTLNATVKIVSSPGTVCVGQIHIGTGSPTSTKPTCELYYRTSGEILIGVENAPSGGQTLHSITNVPMGQKWNYTIKMSGLTLTVTANGVTKSYTLNSGFGNYTHYFKAGCYNQSTGSGAGKVQFYNISIN